MEENQEHVFGTDLKIMAAKCWMVHLQNNGINYLYFLLLIFYYFVNNFCKVYEIFTFGITLYFVFDKNTLQSAFISAFKKKKPFKKKRKSFKKHLKDVALPHGLTVK